MPTWFRCEECEKRYYTAASSNSISFDLICEECGGDLEEVYYNIERFLQDNTIISFQLIKKQPTNRYNGKVLSINDDEINLIVYREKSDILLKELAVCNISFAREEAPEGRYVFTSRILGFYKEENYKIVVETPDALIRKEERVAKRYPLKTRVEYKLGEDFQELMEKAEDDYKIGQTLDISEAGLLLIDEYVEFEELSPDKYVDLEIEYGDYSLSTIGSIARFNRLKEENGKLALGVKFLDETPVNSDLIEELKDGQIDY